MPYNQPIGQVPRLSRAEVRKRHAKRDQAMREWRKSLAATSAEARLTHTLANMAEHGSDCRQMSDAMHQAFERAMGLR